jgi:hypothetical protein
MALRLVKNALGRPKLSDEEAIALVDYYLQRNRSALKSHTKSWSQRHKEVKYKVLL